MHPLQSSYPSLHPSSYSASFHDSAATISSSLYADREWHRYIALWTNYRPKHPPNCHITQWNHTGSLFSSQNLSQRAVLNAWVDAEVEAELGVGSWTPNVHNSTSKLPAVFSREGQLTFCTLWRRISTLLGNILYIRYENHMATDKKKWQDRFLQRVLKSFQTDQNWEYWWQRGEL